MQEIARGLGNVINAPIKLVAPSRQLSQLCDSEISSALNAYLRARQALNAVQVEVDKGLVLLVGNVPTITFKAKLEVIARKEPGVTGVENRLTTDTELFEQVESGLASDPILTEIPIKVIVDRGVVTLKGIVPNAKIKSGAEALVLKAYGVMMVINKIIIEVIDPAIL